MKKYKNIFVITALLVFTMLLLSSCSNNAGEVQKLVDKYCALKTKMHNAIAGTEKEAAIAEIKAFEKEVDDKYFKDNKTYQAILDGMKKCDENFVVDAQPAVTTANNEAIELPTAYGDAVAVANNYCALVDKSIAAAQNGNNAELQKIVAAKIIFEKNMNESFKNNAARRDSIFKLIEPCMKKEVKIRNR